jgi:hypothetical protein
MIETATRPAEAQTPRDHLWHSCSTHPLEGDGPCVLGVCVAFCGARYGGGATTYIEQGVEGPDDCVVCTAMFDERFGSGS